MSDDLFAELERNLTNVGSNKVWKRQIGDFTVWFSPITLQGQEKVSELLGNSEKIGLNIINETKRITLSYSIVGINDVDLREYRDNQPHFPVIGRDGKHTKVSLDKYLYIKMQDWSAQFIDDAFSILSDLFESDQKENLKNIKFENAKDPNDELLELEARVSELRENLGKPQLVEKTKVDVKPAEPVKPVVQPRVDEPEPSDVEFDPFMKVSGSVPRGVEKPDITRNDNKPVAPPVRTIPDIPVLDRTFKDANGNVINAYVPNPSVPNEVIESPTVPVRVPPPVINPTVQNHNPRFSPPSR